MADNPLWLLRHGETSAGKAYIGRSDPPLTALGWQQMQQALEDAPIWTEVVTSPRQRCRQFAERIAAETGCSLQIMPEFAEYDFGIMEGLTAVEVLEQYPGVLDAFWQDPLNNPPPCAELLADFEQRLRTGLKRLAEQPGNGARLVICHGGVIRALRCFEQRESIGDLLKHSAPHGALISMSLETLL